MKRRGDKQRIETKEYLEQYFYYDETSPTFLRWKIDIDSDTKRVVHKDSVAGCITKTTGRTVVTLKGVPYVVSRIILILKGEVLEEGNFVDHIDGDPSNNHLNNLRQVTKQLNSRNCKKYRSKINKYEEDRNVTGVNFTQQCTRKYWVASWTDLSGKCRSKYFSWASLGEEEAFRRACEYRKAMLDKLNKQVAGYTERHGE